MTTNLASSLYPETTPPLASDGFTRIDRVHPTMKGPIEEALALAHPDLPRQRLDRMNVALRGAAFEAGLSTDDLGLLVRTVASQLRNPPDDAQVVKQSQDTMLRLRNEHRSGWDAALKRAADYMDSNPTLARFLGLVPSARSTEAVTRLLVERGQEAYMRDVARAAKAGK